MHRDQRLCPWFTFLRWYLQEAPLSPAVPFAPHLHTAKPDLHVCHRLTCRSQDVFLFLSSLKTKLCFQDSCLPALFLENISIPATPAETAPQGWAHLCLLPGSLFPTPAPHVLLSHLRLSASLHIMTWGNFPSRWICWRYPGMVHLLGICLFPQVSRNTCI